MTTFFITASDTNVGKTYITANLLKLLLDNGYQAKAIKPIETGFNYSNGVPQGSDVAEYQQINPDNNYQPAYYFDYPASPHYSARLANQQIDINMLENYCRQHISTAQITLIEGAGGLLVPFNNQYNFTHLIKRLHIPIILVINNQLGAINQALTNIELCQFHSIDIACVIMNNTDPNDQLALENINFIQTQTDIPIIQIDNNSDEQTFSERLLPIIKPLINHDNNIQAKLSFDKTYLYHPYTSMTQPLPAYHVQYADGKYIYINDDKYEQPIKLLEGMGSWWAVNYGYNRKELNTSAIKQINQFSHVMFGGLTHDPAIDLGKTLIDILPNGLERIFYSDSGSVAVEVAIKMALQYQQGIDNVQQTDVGSTPTTSTKTKILTPLGGYHGDTFGAMSVCDPVNGMHGLFKGILAEQIFIERPNCIYHACSDQPFNSDCLQPLQNAINEHKNTIAGVIIEPIVQGAGGMRFYHPQYLQALREICDKEGILLIFDEIATGFGRTGSLFASDLAQVTPDIICLGKALTGGFISFACTVTTAEVANGISTANATGESNPFMHGPTYMGNPLACAVAKTAIDSLINSDWQTNVKNIQQWLKDGLAPCNNLSAVADVRVLGAIGVVELQRALSSDDVQNLQKYFINQGVWLRPFGKLIYTMPHFNFNHDDINQICKAIYGGVEGL